MIIATAGHIDHGKTLLIRALTGIDTDRLPEEKKREMTIDLGFAYLPLTADRSIAFIDVPGHERFIRNMLCGVAGIDFVVLVVAADDGIMPQTREHLAILDLLGISHGLVALTKIDRVDRARVASVTADIEQLLSPTTLAAVPLFPVSAATSAGIEALQAYIVDAGNKWVPRDPHGQFRLAVDRSFHIRGAGIVVTGTAFAGTAAVGDKLSLQLADLPFRVRGLHANNKPAKRCQFGQRCALNIVGPNIAKQKVKRGDWIVEASSGEAVRRIDTRFRVLASEKRPFNHWTPVHVHLGAAKTTGRIALLAGKALGPGTQGLAQLYLEDAIGACYGDRFIIRDQSARRTIGGGHVIDNHPPARGRGKPARIAALEAMDATDPAAALTALLTVANGGVELGDFRQARNLTADETGAVLRDVPMKRIERRGGARAFLPDRWQILRKAALANLSAWHESSPTSPGLPETQLLTSKDVLAPAEVGVAVAAELRNEGALVKEGTLVRLARHMGGRASEDAALWQRVSEILATSGRVPPTMHELATDLETDVRKVEKLLLSRARRRHVVRIGERRFFSPTVIHELGLVAVELAAKADNGRFSVRAFRDRSGIGRNLVIEVLEYFDEIKLTRRVGDGRELLAVPADLLGSDVDGVANKSDANGRESHPGGAPGLQTR